MESEFQNLFNRCIALAEEISDGHFTLCKFTTNWRAGFFTPNSMMEIQAMVKGDTAEIAMKRALDVLPIAPSAQELVLVAQRFEGEIADIIGRS